MKLLGGDRMPDESVQRRVGTGTSSERAERDPTDAAGAALTIDLGALAANWRRLGAEAVGAECAAVVKADAYGCGIERVAPALARNGCRTFFVAQVEEGARVRAACPGAVVYVLNGLLPGTAPALVRHDLRPVLGSAEEVAEWAAHNRARGAPGAAALHVDTGMNRLGLPVSEALERAADPAWRAELREAAPALLMSHLVSAEVPDDPINARQVSAFDAVRGAYPDLPASLANSSGIFLPARPHHALVRPGYALYGGNPTPDRANPMRPVASLSARIVQVREVGAGARAGYNGRWTAPGPRRLATLSVGYADGYRRAASGTDGGEEAGAALVGGALCPVVGLVSMDLLIVDASGAPGADVARGAPATLIGGALTLEEVGRRAGTIGYEVLTSLGRRYARTYIGD